MNSFVIILIYLGLFIVLYFILIRPNSKRRQQKKMEKAQETDAIDSVEQSQVSDLNSEEVNNSKSGLNGGESNSSKRKFCPYCGQVLSQQSEAYCENCGEKL